MSTTPKTITTSRATRPPTSSMSSTPVRGAARSGSGASNGSLGSRSFTGAIVADATRRTSVERRRREDLQALAAAPKRSAYSGPRASSSCLKNTNASVQGWPRTVSAQRASAASS